MAFYIDTTNNQYYQRQRSIRIIPPHRPHISSFQVQSTDTQCLHHPEISPLFFQAYINTTHKDGSRKSTSVAPFKRPHFRPSFKKLFQEIHTTKNFRSIKRQILQELQSNFKKKAIRNLSFTSYHQMKVKYLPQVSNLSQHPQLPRTTSFKNQLLASPKL